MLLCSQHSLNFAFDGPDTPVHGGGGDVQLHGDLHDAAPPHPQVKHRPLRGGEVARRPEIVALPGSKLC
nr:MAG TPA: hypothetical protein [Caudoviricetes sp.]